MNGRWIWAPAVGSTCRLRPPGRPVWVRLRPRHDRRDADPGQGHAARVGASNVEFIKGQIEDVPPPDSSIHVAIFNCAINLSTDKAAVLVGDVPGADPGRPAGHPTLWPKTTFPCGPGRARVRCGLHRWCAVPDRVPRRPHRGRVHRSGGGVHLPAAPGCMGRSSVRSNLFRAAGHCLGSPCRSAEPAGDVILRGLLLGVGEDRAGVVVLDEFAGLADAG